VPLFLGSGVDDLALVAGWDDDLLWNLGVADGALRRSLLHAARALPAPPAPAAEGARLFECWLRRSIWGSRRPAKPSGQRAVWRRPVPGRGSGPWSLLPWGG